MKSSTKKVIIWSPRILGILFAIFISLFALDVFGEGYGFWDTLLALAMHMIPTLIAVLALVVAWRWARVGAIVYIALAALYLMMSHGESFVLSIPLFLLGILFLVQWILRAELEG